MQRRSKCNSPPINGQCTNRCMVVRCSAVLMWQLKSYNRLVQAVPLKYFQFLYNLQCLHVIFFSVRLACVCSCYSAPQEKFLGRPLRTVNEGKDEIARERNRSAINCSQFS